jgi:hypothetical protein
MTIYPDDICYLNNRVVSDWLDNLADKADDAESIAVITAFAAECVQNVGEYWSAYTLGEWQDYCSESAYEMYGEATLQDAWDDRVWADTCKTDHSTVDVNGVEYVVVAD